MSAPLSMPECQVLMQDIALELTRLDKRLGKINRSDSTTPFLFAGSALEAELPGEVLEVRRRHLQQATLQLLELALAAGQARRHEDEDEATCQENRVDLDLSVERSPSSTIEEKNDGVPFQVEQQHPGDAGRKGTPPCSE